MPTFSFCGSLFATVEYGFEHELEAEIQEEAIQRFEEIMASRHYGAEVELHQVDKPYNISGRFNVFDKPVDEINDVFDFDEAVDTDCEFEGPR